MNCETSSLLNNHRLKIIDKIFYGLGHFHNDVCAALWFSYALVYFQIVTNHNYILSGTLILIGQVVDAAATPLAGYFIDATSKRLIWHIVGSLITVISFPLIFTICTICEGLSVWQGFYYGIFVSLFQTGWALVQISHLAILPELSSDQNDRTNLTSCRFSASMAAFTLVHTIALIFFKKSPEIGSLRYDDLISFLDIALFVDLTGAIFTTIFIIYGLFFIKKRLYPTIIKTTDIKNSIKQLIISSEIYKITGTYTCSRLFLNLTMIYIPLYLNDVLKVEKSSVATVPLAMFISAMIASIIYDQFTKSYYLKYKVIFFIGWLASIMGSLIIYRTKDTQEDLTGVYLASSLFGIGSALTVIISLSLAVNLEKSGNIDGFIFSTVTFSDKIINGLIVFFIEYFKCDELVCPNYYWYIIVYLNGAIMTASLFLLCLIPMKEITTNHRELG